MNAEENNMAQADLNEIVRQASEAACASKSDPELGLLIASIKANLELAKNAVRTVGVSGYRKHLLAVGKAKGLICKQATLKRALVATGIGWAKHRKAKPGPGK